MSDLKITPGPWRVYSDSELIIVNHSGSSLGKMTAGDPYISYKEMAANAAMAAAAPELFAALEYFMDHIAALRGDDVDETMKRKARVALAKAKGRPTHV